VVYAARNPHFSRRFREHKRRLRAAPAEALDLELQARDATSGLPPALAIIGLANGLAVEELSDPGSVSDEMLGEALTLLVAPRPAGGR
jgi:hypothetical protein